MYRVCSVTLTLEIWLWVIVLTHPWDMDNNCVKYYPDPTSWAWKWGGMAWTPIFGMCTLPQWPWPWRYMYDLGSRSWHTLGSWATIPWNIMHIKQGSEEIWRRHRFRVCVHCDLDLGDMTFGQGHVTTLGQGKLWCKILARSNMAVRS